MRNIFVYPIEAVNEIKTNRWSVLLIVIGTILVLHGKSEVGASLTTGGFAILRSSPTEEKPESKEKPIGGPTHE